MSAHRYRHAPIVEAVVEFRFEGEADEKFLDEMARKLKNQFPSQEDQKRREFQFEIPVADNVSASARIDKTKDLSVKRLTDGDGARILLISTSTISVSRLPPYDCFDGLRADAESTWNAAHRLTGVRKLNRIGMRYINRIDLPLDESKSVNFEEYLNLHINVPEKYEAINSYSLVFECPLPEIGCIAKIRSSIGDPALIDHASFFLDIDVIRLAELPVKKADIFRLLDDMRRAKNEMFEEFITDKARAIFDAD